MDRDAADVVTTTQQDKLFEEICSQNQNFYHYERSFQEVLMELESDDVLETFRREYESLHNSFLKCHEGEKRLIKKCLDLQSETASCQQKIRAAEELSAGDQTTIDQLKKEIVKTKAKVALSKETEITLKEKIKQLKVDIKELDKQVDHGAADIAGHGNTISELTIKRAELHKNYETQRSHLISLQKDTEWISARVEKAREAIADKKDELGAVRDAIGQKESEREAQRSRKESTDKALRARKDELARRNALQQEGQAMLGELSAEISTLERRVQAEKEAAEQGNRHLTNLGKQMQQTRDQLADCGAAVAALQETVGHRTQDLKLKQGEVNAAHAERVKQEKLLDANEKRNMVLDQQRREAEMARDSAKLQMQQKELQTSAAAKLLDGDVKQLEDLSRERDVLNKSYLKAESATQKQQDWLVIKENQRRNLEHQIRGYERHGQAQNELIFQLSKETENYEKQASDAAVRCSKILEESKTLDNLTAEEQGRIREAEGKLKQQQSMLDTVLNERNTYAKTFNQLRIEIAEMGRRFKVMINQIKQLKEEIQTKERELVTEEVSVTEATTLRKKHEIRIDTCRKKTEKREKTIDAYNVELHKLNQIITDADAERARQRRDHTNVINERDILGSQLIKRNDELAALYEHIRIQQFQLRKGESQYSDRLQDIQQLELRISQLGEELERMRLFASRLPDLKLHINKSQRELTREQCRVRALLDESDKSQNMHRLHRLKWSEPQTYDLHQRIYQLQRELVKKNNEVEQKGRLVAEKEKLFVELKGVIARQPGPEVAEQLNVYQDTLAKKVSQMRAMKISLRHFHTQVEHYKSQYEELNDELNAMGKSYKASRKAEAREARRTAVLNEMLGRDGSDGGAPQRYEEAYVGYTAPPRPQTQEGEGLSPYQSGGEGGDASDGGADDSPYQPREPYGDVGATEGGGDE